MWSTSVNFRKKQSREAYISKIKPTWTSCIMHYEPRKKLNEFEALLVPEIIKTIGYV